MKLILVRHLPTDWNAKGLLQGRQDRSILEPTGKLLETIKENQKRLDQHEFDRVLASRLSRTQETARLYGFERVTEEPLLDELDFGEFEGRPKRALQAWRGGLWQSNPASLTLGEPVSHLEKRIRAFIKKNASTASVLVFGHGAWSRALLSLYTHDSLDLMNQLTLDHNQLVEINLESVSC